MPASTVRFVFSSCVAKNATMHHILEKKWLDYDGGGVSKAMRFYCKCYVGKRPGCIL